MNKLIERLAELSKVPPAKAADQIDGLVHEVLTGLKKGKPIHVQGLGKFFPGPVTTFVGEKSDAGAKRNWRNRRKNS